MKIVRYNFGVAAIVCGNILVNTTPHPIAFEENGMVVVVPESGVVVNASAVKKTVRTDSGVTYVRTVFYGNDENTAKVNDILTECPFAIIVGSMIAAQAYPGKVFAMTPMPGFERVAPAEKRMNPLEFTTFEKNCSFQTKSKLAETILDGLERMNQVIDEAKK